ncbi:hypothetical protein N825_04430 [Skermanella stibiiresistens SB22]|uniref:CYTH domain-containing protein n=1 Tax=Skermanella stibiiresistens SB22 TaxID=1385369 RepID=W9H7I7_9PROT|nr:CYTH domain-containing protein [Skermanella stibiiresistens]EWY39763.1 hypothetical protein N825_04430 [Skermanella stibiiresistens SB22]
MSFEIERRFLVCQDVHRLCVDGDRILQGYFSFDGQSKIRIRTRGDEAFLTIKGPRHGVTRTEYERNIPVPLAAAMLSRLPWNRLIQKTRYIIPHDGMDWEIDVFEGLNAGLIIAEIELAHAEQEITLPPWIGREVTYDDRYGNSNLSVDPISAWVRAA